MKSYCLHTPMEFGANPDIRKTVQVLLFAPPLLFPEEKITKFYIYPFPSLNLSLFKMS